jgi:hypothetical protein
MVMTTNTTASATNPQQNEAGDFWVGNPSTSIAGDRPTLVPEKNNLKNSGSARFFDITGRAVYGSGSSSHVRIVARKTNTGAHMQKIIVK